MTLNALPGQEAQKLQHRALSLLTDTQPTFVEGIINIYHLNALDPARLRLHIVRLQALHCYKEVYMFYDDIGQQDDFRRKCNWTSLHSSQAAVVSIKLKLQKELNMEEVRWYILSWYICVAFVHVFLQLLKQKPLLYCCDLEFSSADLCSLNLARQAVAGRVVRHRPQSPRATTPHAARLLVPPQLHCRYDKKVWSMCTYTVHVAMSVRK